MKSIIKSLGVAFSRYSIFVPSKDREDCRWICLFIPWIGFIIGFVINRWGTVYPYLCNYSVMPAVVGAIIPTIISAGAHLDGFFRTVDSLCSHKNKEEKLAIIKEDAHGGYFAIIVCICYFLLSIGVWSEMDIQGIFVLSFQYVISRSIWGITIMVLPQIPGGKEACYIPENKLQRAVQVVILSVYIAICAVWMISINPEAGIACLIATLIAVIYYVLMVYRHFGGITEELGGFLVTLCEMLMPLATLFVYKKWF